MNSSINTNAVQQITAEAEQLRLKTFEAKCEQAFKSKELKDVYPHLTGTIKKGADLFTGTEKEVFVIGTLVLFSGLMNTVIGFYYDRMVSANLFLFVKAFYGSGKGTLSTVKRLTSEITKEAKEWYAMEMNEYNQLGKEAKAEAAIPIMPLLYIPADNSKTGIIENLADNNSEGIIFETESDNLAQTLKTDYGGFSDVLRRLYHHEDISYNRRSNHEYREVNNPKVTTILSGTPDQFLLLIPSVDNGLYSRFCYYELEAVTKFENPFCRKRKEAHNEINRLAFDVKAMYDELKKMEIEIHITPQQETVFEKIFDTEKVATVKELGEHLNGQVNRLALMVFRVCMVLTIQRHFKNGTLSENLTIHDDDFINALRFGGIFKENYLLAMEALPAFNSKKPPKKNEKEQQALKLFSEGISRAEICKRLNIGRTTLYRYLK